MESDDPFETKERLEAWLPKDRWQEVSDTFRAFGQIICKPDLPDCVSCAIKDICPKKKMDDMKPDNKKLDYEKESVKVTDPLKKVEPAAVDAEPKLGNIEPKVNVTQIKSSKGMKTTSINSK